MIVPPSVKSGDKVGILSTANSISYSDIFPAIQLLKSWGLDPVIGKTIGLQHGSFAGTDQERLEDFQMMLDDPEIKCIHQAAGGYGSVRIIDDVDFTSFKKKPKWVCGYSDVTYLHWHLQGVVGSCSVQSTMPVDIRDQGLIDESWETLRKVIFGEKVYYSIPPARTLRKEGVAEGVLVGGNLSIISNLSGSNSDIDLTGKILFIEDIDQHYFHLDGFMMALRKTSRMQKLRGLLVGRLTNIIEDVPPYGKTPEEIIIDAVADFDFPVCLNYPAGHEGPHYAMPFGKRFRMEVKSDETVLKEL